MEVTIITMRNDYLQVHSTFLESLKIAEHPHIRVYIKGFHCTINHFVNGASEWVEFSKSRKFNCVRFFKLEIFPLIMDFKEDLSDIMRSFYSELFEILWGLSQDLSQKDILSVLLPLNSMGNTPSVHGKIFHDNFFIEQRLLRQFSSHENVNSAFSFIFYKVAKNKVCFQLATGCHVSSWISIIFIKCFKKIHEKDFKMNFSTKIPVFLGFIS